MKVMFAIALRELNGYIRQPAGWIILALYLLLAGIVFAASVLVPGRAATLRDFFALSGWLFLPVVPAVSMRLIAEELRSGSIEYLLTSPVGCFSLVWGKYLGALAFIILLLIPTLTYPTLLILYSNPAPPLGPLVAGYMCLILLGGVYLGIGLIASTLTANPTLAFMLTLFSILGVLFAPLAADASPSWAREVLARLSFGGRIADFSRGILDTGHIIFFATIAAASVMLSGVVMEVRRWR
jgi:ABC-2 type transport system permease protein